MSRSLRTTAALVAFCASACGDSGAKLEGSLTELLSLKYEQALVSRSETEVAVRFVRARGAGEDTLLAISADLTDATVGPEGPIDLAELAPSGQPRGRVSRNVLDDPRTDFPPIALGTFQLSEAPSAGASLTGSVHVTFLQGTEFGSGRTVFGDFEATVP